MADSRNPPAAAGSSADLPKKGSNPSAAVTPPSAESGLDFAIEEIAPAQQLKEGFSGQER